MAGKSEATRLPDWHIHLIQYIGERARTPIVDPDAPVCAEFTAGAVEAMTGRGLGIAWRGKYPTTVAGLRALRKGGVKDHIALVAQMFDEIPPAMAGAGDIAVLRGEGKVKVLGIVQGPNIYVQSANGVGAFPLTDAIAAYRVV